MKQGAEGTARPSAGARVRVIRGEDPCAVARAVSETVEEGLVLPAGPYRYPYAAVCALLRNAGSFADPSGDTATDPVLSRDVLIDGLRELLSRRTVIGLTLADEVDAASARMFGQFAETARLAAEQGLRTGGLVLGTVGNLPLALSFDGADIRDTSALSAPASQLSLEAQHVLKLIAGAPHPVTHHALRSAAGLPAAYLQAALLELSSGELVVIGERIGLGSGVRTGEPQSEWLDTAETRLPVAALSISRDVELARNLGHAAVQRGDYESAVYCFGFAGPGRAADAIACARSLVGTGSIDPARAVFDELIGRELPQAETLALGALGVLLVECSALDSASAERVLRRVNSVESRGWRARLMIACGRFDSARNLLRRTKREELEEAAPDARLEHELATAACLRNAGRPEKAERKLREIENLCATRADRRRLGLDSVRLAALDLSAGFLRKCNGGAVLKDVLVPVAAAAIYTGSPQEMFACLRAHGATLMAALEGDLLIVVPRGALARPGLAAQVRGKLRRMRDHPQAFSFGSEEFDSLGPFAGRSMLALQRKSGPMFVLFRPGCVPDVAQLLKDTGEL